MPETAENVAEDFNVSREDQDRFAAWSQAQRAGAALANGRLAKEITAVMMPRAGPRPSHGRHRRAPRPGTTVKKLAKLPTPFARDDGSVTAGNASGVNDGACALLVASEAAVENTGSDHWRVSWRCPPRGWRRASWVSARRRQPGKALARTVHELDQIDVTELNEAFASAGACGDEGPRSRRRRPTHQPQRRRHRARPSSRDERRTPRDHRRHQLRERRALRPLPPCASVSGRASP